MQTTPAISPFPVVSIAIISATALSYEILLTRLFAIIQYHHFAYMIISLALLGYGVSGTLLSLFRDTLTRHYPAVFLASTILFAASTLLCFLIAQHIAFNAEEMLWDYSQSLRLLGTYLLLMLPFLFAANAIGLSLMVFGHRIGKLYGADLLGAGTGSVAIIGLLFVLPPNQVLPVLAALGLIAAIVACRELQYCGLKTTITLAFAIVLLFLIPARWLTLEISPYKGLPQLLRVEGTSIVATRSSPLGLLQVVDSPVIPLRHAPGLSLNARSEPPPQLAVFVDGDGLAAINARAANDAQLSFLDQQTSAAVYHLTKASRVLILGAGSGNDILQARYHQAASIDGVELNPQMVELMTNDYADFSGRLFSQPGISIHVQDARGFITSSKDKFDIIQMALLDSHSASASGLYALSENYLYTVEALKQYLAHLQPEGYLSITRWIKLPPRDSLKLLATVASALRESGVTDPEQRLVLIRSWQTSTLLVKNGVITADEINRLQSFCSERFFDTAYFPGIQAAQTNRYNILREPVFYQAASALLGSNAEQFKQQYKFNLEPATDNQPYFANFFKWQLLPEIMQLKGKGGMPLMEWGYIILVATLLQAVLASVILILFPLVFSKLFFSRTTSFAGELPLATNLIYFTALGLGFLFVEIAFMQKFTLYLHHPLYSIAITLAAFLIFAGWGSNISKQWQQLWGYSRSIKIAIAGIIVTGTLYGVLLDFVFAITMGWPTLVKIFITAVVIAPLAFCMGMPFPLALGFLSEHYPKLVSWVWGVNGCASVVSAVLAMLLAIHAGFTVVLFSALLLYALAWLIFSSLAGRTAQQF